MSRQVTGKAQQESRGRSAPESVQQRGAGLPFPPGFRDEPRNAECGSDVQESHGVWGEGEGAVDDRYATCRTMERRGQRKRREAGERTERMERRLNTKATEQHHHRLQLQQRTANGPMSPAGTANRGSVGLKGGETGQLTQSDASVRSERVTSRACAEGCVLPF